MTTRHRAARVYTASITTTTGDQLRFIWSRQKTATVTAKAGWYAARKWFRTSALKRHHGKTRNAYP